MELLGLDGLLAKLLPLRVRQLGAIGAQDFLLVSDEALANQVLAAVGPVAVKALVVPMATVKRDELGTTNA